ncbi:MAG: hypothetical protein MJZ48_00065 [Paludibacteraceae bacterium]|nr:hypothetical protein [Paludibacteraceae bacterium]
MKIVGYTYHNGSHHYTMKCDASLLNQRKPFFVPDWAQDFRYIPCVVARICRLGKCIDQRYAARYYDAVASGLDFVAYDLLNTHYAQATAFDNSLCVGEWRTTTEADETTRQQIAQAIHQASQIVTLRMGDLVYIDLAQEAQPILLEQIIEDNLLYCKIK